jgi:predicted alpha/beta superfamily hydrolase
MFKKHIVRSRIYFAVAALGLVTAWVLNALAVTQEADYLNAWFGSYVDWVLSLDLLVVGIAVITLMLVEAKRLGMKRVWLYFLLSGITAMAFTFPLFMAFRERKLLERRLAGGSMEKFEFDNHRVDVWAPKTITATTPILIMHDGRNLFDEKDSYTGKTWEILTAMREEVRGPQPIVIGLWGLSDLSRLRELAPQKILDNHQEIWDHMPEEYKDSPGESLGDAYVSLMADAIIPFVLDRHQITHHPDRTAVMGSSMGGLMSLYAMGKRPEVFGTAIGFSTHWPFGGDFMVQELTDLLPIDGNHRIWTDTGTIELDENYAPFHEAALEKIKAKGYLTPDSLVGATYPNTGHHESYWARRVAEALNWWLRSGPRT